MSVLIYIELENGSIKKTSLETIAYGAKVAEKNGGKAIVLAIGNADASELEKAGRYGAAKVLHATDQRLEHENSMAYADILVQAVQQEESKVVILPKSGLGDAMAARAAARLKAAVVSGVTQLPETDGVFTVTRSVFSGKAFATTQIHSEIKILVVKKNVIEVDENAVATGNAEIVPFSPAFRGEDFKATVIQVEKTNTELSLTEADIIVSGGRGMKGPENWQPLVDFAHALGAATGCSKPVSDLDWRPHHEHIGQTGIKVAPNLYIACGISGAIQHLAGVNGSKCIVVINKDPEAPFFKAADYGIVGDIFEILPRLTEAAKKLK
ncbi:electron transfer flavoprotein subunit alpha/FixB family protein [Dyadobacter sediminis]|uniref:Electron transfer flavoprotein subunit alpha/FixB family protein n=1 Tax=Dyadobacter sediminis TaxID=1493691 RepID=A0A5R9KIX9_9BACT|nr:electron transfer flavoprotein subunit alpha/FixB family protein [Dyadobacter sediminis]TLU96173.1 electron transfer flavoprotein subunit alpha/FixB family protein [Dyadobacter sediminis]GGB79883.1 electron transfer flavoprotein subunit alpha [Dyadobacter sediminis]